MGVWKWFDVLLLLWIGLLMGGSLDVAGAFPPLSFLSSEGDST